jgi:hypothetical protein
VVKPEVRRPLRDQDVDGVDNIKINYREDGLTWLRIRTSSVLS